MMCHGQKNFWNAFDYFGIVGKFGGNVQNVLKKVSGFDIQTICPLHGPVLKEDLGYYLGLYDRYERIIEKIVRDI